ncbi:MAG: peptidylprolyl isomerase [Bacteroidetes bacterium]|nr:MAG: peptidylprolyl isomerase [Bacteroidota bacterium]TAG94274.1 MAG: peptidylprolyl isomerase [Bacteroidota bacterium]
MKKYIISILIVSLLAINHLFSQDIMGDKIIASVDNHIILKSELETRIMDLLARQAIKANDAEARCQVLQELIIQKMMLAKAEIDSVNVEDKVVESQVDRRVQYLLQSCCGGDATKLEKLYNKTMPDLKKEVYDLVKEQMVGQKMENEIIKDIKITPKEVKKFYNGIPKDSVPQFKAEVQVAHLVRIPEVSKEQKQEARRRLDSLKKIIESGESFEKIASEYSEDIMSAKEGGKLGWMGRGKLVPEYEAAVFKLKPNELSPIVESQFGFHLIKLYERRGNEQNSAHILIRPNFDAVDLQAETKFLDSLRLKVMKDSASFAKFAKEYSHDKPTAYSGGDITNSSGSTKVFIDEIDTFVYSVIDTMKVGQISRPVPYRTDDGKSAVRILFYKKRTEGHTCTFESDYDKVYTFALNNKKQKAIEEWFKKTKDQLFIKVDDEFKDCPILNK